MRKLLLAICGLAALATTPVSAADGPACVRRNDIRDWSSPVRKTLILESYGHNTVKLTMNGTCRALAPTTRSRSLARWKAPRPASPRATL
jgi:hypothetical protein